MNADGFKFPATQVPSADANTLDDYEEGTWTPEIHFSTTDGNLSVAYATQGGNYVKIGSLVHVCFMINTSTFTHSTASGNMRITGLPFTGDGYHTAGNVDHGGITVTNVSTLCPYVVGGQTYIQIYGGAEAGGARFPLNIANTTSGTQVYLVGSVIYTV